MFAEVSRIKRERRNPMNFEKKRDLLYLDIMDYMGTEFIDRGLIMSRDVNFRIGEQHYKNIKEGKSTWR